MPFLQSVQVSLWSCYLFWNARLLSMLTHTPALLYCKFRVRFFSLSHLAYRPDQTTSTPKSSIDKTNGELGLWKISFPELAVLLSGWVGIFWFREKNCLYFICNTASRYRRMVAHVCRWNGNGGAELLQTCRRRPPPSPSEMKGARKKAQDDTLCCSSGLLRVFTRD